jgi:hypothetical protein
MPALKILNSRIIRQNILHGYSALETPVPASLGLRFL